MDSVANTSLSEDFMEECEFIPIAEEIERILARDWSVSQDSPDWPKDFQNLDLFPLEKHEYEEALSSLQQCVNNVPHFSVLGNTISQLHRNSEKNLVENLDSYKLHKAASKGLQDIVLQLLVKGHDANEIDVFGNSPLFYASFSNHEQCKQLLEKYGAKYYIGESVIQAIDSHGGLYHKDAFECLCQWAKNNMDSRFRIYSQNGIKIEELTKTRERAGNFPLHVAVENGNYAITDLLLKNGANVHVYNLRNETPKELAYRKGFISIANLLAGKEWENDDGVVTSLHIAANLDNLNEAERILNKYPHFINRLDSFGNTPLMYAIIKNSIEMVRLLLSHGADCNIGNKSSALDVLEKLISPVSQHHDTKVTTKKYAAHKSKRRQV